MADKVEWVFPYPGRDIKPKVHAALESLCEQDLVHQFYEQPDLRQPGWVITKATDPAVLGTWTPPSSSGEARLLLEGNYNVRQAVEEALYGLGGEPEGRASGHRIEDTDTWEWKLEKVAEYEGWIKRGLKHQAAADKLKIARRTLDGWKERRDNLNQ